MSRIKNLTEDLTEQVFGSWKVKYRDENNKHLAWICICKCGREKSVRTSWLINGNRQCSYCYNESRTCGLIPGRLLRQIEKVAIKRNFEFSVTPQYLWGLFLKQQGKCALSGIKLEFFDKTASLDRIDSKEGYIAGNLQWVHKDINHLKMNLLDDELCKTICNNQDKLTDSYNQVIPRLSKHILVDKKNLVIDLQKSFGSWIIDGRSKKKYLDCFSQYASQPIGWNHPKIIENIDRLHNVCLNKLANGDCYTEEYCNFVKTFSEITQDFKYLFFISGGCLAVENALKAAFDWKSKKLGKNESYCNNLDVIHLKEAFHGRSGYTLSLTNTDTIKTDLFPKFNWTRVLNPKISSNLEEIKENEDISLREIEESLKNDNVAAVIIEPIQGEGGDNHFRNNYLKQIKILTEKYSSLLIFDEIQTGIGLTGKMWCYQHFDVTPDIIVFGKKSQVCGFAASSKIDEIPDNVFHVPGRIGSTWSGDLTDMVRSTIYLEIIKEDHLVENAAVVGNYFIRKLSEIGLLNLRGRGLMIAFDFETSDKRDEFLDRLSERMLAIKCGKKSVRLRPHLTFGKIEADFAVDFIRRAL